jgi:phytoene dehydrogenase-like protein
MTWNAIVVGTGIASILEAISLWCAGKRVLMIDSRPHIGGVWAPRAWHGLNDVQSAVHYFVHDDAGHEFMSETLQWDLDPVEDSWLILPKGYRVPLHSIAGRAIYPIAREWAAKAEKSIWRDFFFPVSTRLLSQCLSRKNASFFPRGGTPEIFRRIGNVLSRTDIELRLNTTVQRIEILESGRCEVALSNVESLTAETVYISSQTDLKEISQEGENAIPIDSVRFRYPHVRLLLEDSNSPSFLQASFPAHFEFLHVNDVTRYVREANQLLGRFKLINVMCNSCWSNIDESFILRELKCARLVGSNAKVVMGERFWFDTPVISDDTLDRIAYQSGFAVQTLKTENFCRAIGFYGKTRWKNRLSPSLFEEVPSR